MLNSPRKLTSQTLIPSANLAKVTPETGYHNHHDQHQHHHNPPRMPSEAPEAPPLCSSKHPHPNHIICQCSFPTPLSHEKPSPSGKKKRSQRGKKSVLRKRFTCFSKFKAPSSTTQATIATAPAYKRKKRLENGQSVHEPGPGCSVLGILAPNAKSPLNMNMTQESTGP